MVYIYIYIVNNFTLVLGCLFSVPGVLITDDSAEHGAQHHNPFHLIAGA